jgi:hypothetical protein
LPYFEIAATTAILWRAIGPALPGIGERPASVGESVIAADGRRANLKVSRNEVRGSATQACSKRTWARVSVRPSRLIKRIQNGRNDHHTEEQPKQRNLSQEPTRFLSPLILHACTVSGLIVRAEIQLTGIFTGDAKDPTAPAGEVGYRRK